MSRLDGIASHFDGDTNQAKIFARNVRAQFDVAPSNAEILIAVRQCPAKIPSVQQVVAQIKRNRTEKDERRAAATRGRSGAGGRAGSAPRPSRGSFKGRTQGGAPARVREKKP